MNRKVLLLAIVFIMAFSLCAYGEEKLTGILTASSIPEEEVNAFISSDWVWTVSDGNYTSRYKNYDSLVSMQMALNRGDISEIDVPQAVGEYIIMTNKDYKINSVVRTEGANYVFGFLKGDKGASLRKRFNAALGELRSNGTLDSLKSFYIDNVNHEGLFPVEFDKFEGAETIRAAVTGDLPPIDYIAADGRAAGFNTALLAEIARLLKVNVELVQVETAARTPALVSGRADVVFWYMLLDNPLQADIPEEVIISHPYYSWNIYVRVGKK